MWQSIQFSNLKDYQESLTINPLIASIFAYHHLSIIEAEQILNHRFKLASPTLLNDLESAVIRINKAIENDEKIVIYGDYDCDGMMATTILYLTFKQLGHPVGYYIPHRLDDGYGLNAKRVQQFKDKGYQLIITVDNGIAALEAVEVANELDIDVIITDHHQPQAFKPDAKWVVHPLFSERLAFKHYSGGVVAYKLAVALLNKHNSYMMSLAAITTISDMMPLRGENREIVRLGLREVNKHQFKSLYAMNQYQSISVIDIGFKIAPMINALGRLPDEVNPNYMVKYLSGEMDDITASTFLKEAMKVNQLRKKKVDEVLKRMTIDEDASMIIVVDATIEEGITGLIANRLMKAYHKPAFVLTLAKDEPIYKGSARSIPGFELPELFEVLKEYLQASGGHDYAGGLAVLKENLDDFKEAILEIGEMEHDDTVEPVLEHGILVDFPISVADVEILETLEPFGKDFEKPLFAFKDVKIIDFQLLKNNKHLKLKCEFKGQLFDALLFNQKDAYDQLINHSSIEILGDLSINQYMNQKQINVIIKDFNVNDD